MRLCPPMQSPKSPVYSAGYRSASSLVDFPLASRPGTVSGISADRTGFMIVLKIAREEMNDAVHDEANAIAPGAV